MWIGGLVEVKLMLAPLIWGILLILVGILWVFTSFKTQYQEGFGYSNMIELSLGLILSGLIFGIVIGGL